MKKRILFWLWSQRNQIDQKLKKKILIGIGIFAGFIFLGGLVLAYLGFKAASFVISQVPNQQQVVALANEVKNQGASVAQVVVKKDCWAEIQEHLNLHLWIVRPFSENIKQLSAACLNAEPETTPDMSEGTY